MGVRLRRGGKPCGGLRLLSAEELASIGSNIRIESIRRLGYHLEVSGDD